MGNYDDVARRERERQEKGKGKVEFKPVVYGEEERCKNCMTRLVSYETQEGKTGVYCPNCAQFNAPVV